MININVSTPNDSLGTPLRNAFIIVNDNFQELLGLINSDIQTVPISGVTGLQTILNLIDSDITNLENNLYSLTNSTQTDITELQNDILSLENTVSGHTVNINALQNSINGIQNQLIVINNTISQILDDLVNSSKQFDITVNTTLNDTHHNAILKIKGIVDINIPTGLRNNFNCVFRTFTGFDASFVPVGTTLDAPSGEFLASNKMATLFKDGTTETFILEGELST